MQYNTVQLIMFVNKQVHAQWLKHFIFTGEEGLEYIIPGRVFISFHVKLCKVMATRNNIQLTVYWFASASLELTLIVSRRGCLSVCVSVCLSRHLRSNISETKGDMGSVTIGSL